MSSSRKHRPRCRRADISARDDAPTIKVTMRDSLSLPRTGNIQLPFSSNYSTREFLEDDEEHRVLFIETFIYNTLEKEIQGENWMDG